MDSVGEKPNILWICTDQQRFDSIRALGNERVHTPNLDELVEGGVAFTNAFCQNPLCQPSRSSFLTGRYPRTVGIRQNGQVGFPAREKLITKTLAENGYTCGLAGKLHISAASKEVEKRTNDGYSEFHWSHHPSPEPRVAWGDRNEYQTWLKEKGVDWDEIHESGVVVTEGIPEEFHHTTWCVEKALEFIEKRNAPWCFSLNLFDPHHPFDPPKKYLDMYDPDDMPDPAYRKGELDNKPFWQKIDHRGAYGGGGISFAKMSPRERREVTAAYYAMITLVDCQIGRVFERLRECGEFDDTVIIFMSDHGELLGDHGMYLKGPHFYDCSVKVPLIISYPKRFKKGLRSDALVELLDIVPTLHEITGIPETPGIQGKSLASICEGSSDPGEHKESVYCEYYNTHVLYDGKKLYGTMYRDNDYKVVVYHGEDMGELYDLRNDPGEFENLWDVPGHAALKLEYMKKCFDNSVFIMDPLPLRNGTW